MPHQVPRISQPRERQTRRMKKRLRTGMKPPMDLRGSVVQSAHKARPVERIAKTPAVLRTAESVAAQDGAKLRL
jgi:hypothetical protein